MLLAHQILDFFLGGYQDGHVIRPYSTMDFIKKHPDRGPKVYENLFYFNRLTQDNLLTDIGMSGDHPFYRTHYYTNKGIYEKDISNYGGYDLMVQGMRSVRQRFAPLVLPVNGQYENENYDIGSCFVYDHCTVLTARHCVEEVARFAIVGHRGDNLSIERLFLPENDRIDAALIKVPPYTFPKESHHMITRKPEGRGPGDMDDLNEIDYRSSVLFAPGNILDEVLTIGYPPISGLEAIQIAERVAINSDIFRTSEGSILATEPHTSTGIRLHLINAKVKGGNSGGPIFDKYGRVVGMVLKAPNDILNPDKLEYLGYGFALPSKYLFELVSGQRHQQNSVVEKALITYDNNWYSFE